MHKKNFNNFYFNSNVMNEEQYEILIKHIMHTLDTENRQVLYNYFITNKKNTNINYRPHISPIQKITKNYTILDIKNKIHKIYKNQNIELLIEEKIDGIMINLIYHEGILKAAITRGNSYGGEDIIDAVKNIVPQLIPINITIEIRGELTMKINDYQKYFTEYTSQRHAMLAIISKKSINPFHIKMINFYAHDTGLLSKKSLPNSQEKTYKYINALNINSVEFIKSNILDLEKQFLKFTTICNKILQKDGYIIKINNIDLQLQYFTKYTEESSYCFAHKQTNVFQTIIVKIQINFNKHGACIPIAYIKPKIIFQNIICNKINLYSYNFVIKNKLQINSKIQILFKAIFVFDKNLDQDTTTIFKFPKNCPYCSSELKIIGLNLYCTNISCKNKIINTISLLCKQIGIYSISSKTIKIFVEKKIINNILDIFNIKNKIDKLFILENFGDKKLQNVINAIDTLKQKISLTQIILCFGIPSIGTKTAHNIAQIFLKEKKININHIQNMKFLNKKQKEEITIFFQNLENFKTAELIIKTCLNQ